ncbi:MAG: exodeoxyribonuclease III [Meiothermus sp.]|nr:exodeoxyribonuclease III [Meiothermus sp.]
MRIVTWNVNSLNVRLAQVLEWLQTHQPDVLCLQETKLEDSFFPLLDLEAAGYKAVFSGQRTYNGVAIMSKHPLEDVQMGIPGFEDEQKRVIAATVNGIRVVNLYVPNGEALDSPKFEYKQRWLGALIPWLDSVLKAHPKTVVLGDFNIAPEALDVWNPKRLMGDILCSPAERQLFQQLLGVGLKDSLRTLEPNARVFSWWDFRGGGFQKDQGLRIDHVLVSDALAPELRGAWVDRDARAVSRASDHAPVVCDLFELRTRHQPSEAPSAGEQGIPDAEEFVPPAGRTLPEGQRTRPTSTILIDGHSLAFRMYYGVPPVKAPDGTPVHAVLGFARALLEVYREAGGDPTRETLAPEGPAMLVVFDAPVATFRHQLYPDYKGGRDEIPADLPAQIRLIKRLVDAMGWVRLEVAEVEADDAIGTLAKHAEAAGIPSLIVSSDRDLFQLLSPLTKVRSKEGRPIGPEELRAQYGVTVEQWVDYRALTGDTSDNIPGAKGVGEKTAAGLLQKYGSLEGILAALQGPDLERPLRLVQASEASVRLSHELAKLKLDVETGVGLEEAATVVRSNEALGRLLDELGFKSLKRELHLGEAGAVPAAQVQAQTPAEPFEAFTGAVVGVANGEMVLLDGQQRTLRLTDLPALINAVEAKSIVRSALWEGHQAAVGDDPLLMAYVEDSRITSAEKLAQRFGKAWPADAEGRARLTRELLGQAKAAQTPAARKLYADIERPLATVLAQMEVEGVLLDQEYLAALAQDHKKKLAELEQRIQELAGRPFKVSSRNQLEALLFDELKLEAGRQTALTNKRSTDNETLNALMEAHPIVPLILEHREIAKLVGTYLEPLPRWVSPKTGRLHTTFDQTNAATGRLASLNPNLQNIPIRTELGRPIRGAFLAAPGYRLISADYSQIELRILAHISGDAALMQAFASGQDIHRITAARIAGIPLEQVTREQRSNAKAINYGLSYGLSVVGLAERTGLSRSEAGKFIRRYFEEYPGIQEYITQTKRFCKEHGYVEDIYGRRRYIPDIAAPAAAIRSRAENASINSPVQGSCASIIKAAMVQVAPLLRPLGAKLLLQVHDELLVEAAEDRVEEVSKILCDAMREAAQLKVPLEVEVGHGKNWLEAH